MLRRQPRTFESLSVSALDLFATALGVFVLLAVMLFPYYLKKPSIDAAQAGAAGTLAAAQEELDRARKQLESAEEAKQAAEARKSAASRALASATADTTAVANETKAAEEAALSAKGRLDSVKRELGNLKVFDLDLLIVMDMTGSMREELDDIRANLLGIIRTLQRLSPSLHMGFIAFKDYPDEYLTRAISLAPMQGANLIEMQSFIERLSAKGGGDPPEPVSKALDVGVKMSWREGVRGRILVIGDAPDRPQNVQTALSLASRFAGSGSAAAPRKVSVIFTGRNRPGMEFFQQLAQAGSGDFQQHRGRMIESVLLAVLEERR